MQNHDIDRVVEDILFRETPNVMFNRFSCRQMLEMYLKGEAVGICNTHATNNFENSFKLNWSRSTHSPTARWTAHTARYDILRLIWPRVVQTRRASFPVVSRWLLKNLPLMKWFSRKNPDCRPRSQFIHSTCYVSGIARRVEDRGS